MSPNKSFNGSETGITGLETAIILIAFVVVASVFAYVVLSAGIFATQKSQEAIYHGLDEAKSAIEMRGNLIAKAEIIGTSGQISQFIFTVGGALGITQPIDFTGPNPDPGNTGLAAAGSNNLVVVTYQDQDQCVQNLYWTVNKLGAADPDDLLENDEMFEIIVGAPVASQAGGNLIDALDCGLGPNKSFSLEIKPPNGATLNFERTTPAYIDNVINLN